MILNKNIVCPVCKASFLTKKSDWDKNLRLSHCKCNIYPIVEGILYLTSKNNKKLLSNLKNNYGKTVAHLLAFSFQSKIFFYITRGFATLYKLFGFKNFIKLLTLLSYPKGWTRYLLNRERIPSFFLGLFSLSLIKHHSQLVIDLGCGTGNNIPYYYDWIAPENLIVIDKSFLNLFISKLFFSKPGTTLICSDLNKELPIKVGEIDLLYMIDGFHYVKNKKGLLKESKKILNKKGIMAFIHALNTGTPKDSFALPISPKTIANMLRKYRLKNFLLIQNKMMWDMLKSKGKINLKHSKFLNQTYAYNIFASKKELSTTLTMSKKYSNLLKNTQINYYQDPDIIKNTLYD